MAGKWTEEKARQQVVRANGVVGKKSISHPMPGIKALGAIDYLCKVHGYTWSKT